MAAIVARSVDGLAATYANPLDLRTPDGAAVESCADPTVIRSRATGDPNWYLYCTADPLRSGDGTRRIPIFRSPDLIHWTYVADVFATVPSWGEAWSGLWAPEIRYSGGTYFLYYAMTDVKRAISGELGCGSDSAIGVATASSPAGPWTDHGSPVVAPRRRGAGCSFQATIDPEIVDTPTQRYILYGSYAGGIEARTLSADGFAAPAASAIPIAIGDRYEAAEVLEHDGWYWLFVSAATCCSGPLSGYGVFVARSASPTGPYEDRHGRSLLATRTGGTPVLRASGDGWVGPGHPTLFADEVGRIWTIYHAVDSSDPYFGGSVGFTKRPPMLDAIDWDAEGWPTVRGGWGHSTCPIEAPAAQPGETSDYVPVWRPDSDAPGATIPSASDEFDGTALSGRWSWIRPPASGWSVSGGAFHFDTQAADLYVDDNSASVLVEEAPAGDIVVETRLHLDVPASGCCFDYVQAGLALYGTDDRYVRLTHVSIGGTRQTEFGKEDAPVPAGFPRYGSSVGGPPSDWTWLRIARRIVPGGETYTAYDSTDGVVWTRGSTWTHALGASVRIGLLSMGGAGYHADFDHVRTYALAPDPGHPEEGAPPEIANLVVGGGSPSTVSWAPAPKADLYDVSRGTLGGLASGGYGPCVASGIASTSVVDAEAPLPQVGFVYLVRGVNPGCGGSGSWGARSDGSPRGNADPGACP